MGKQKLKTALLLSGGIDSVAIAYWKHPDLAVTVDYGQIPSQAEIRAASKVCEELDVPHEVISVDCSHLGAGNMTSQSHQLDTAPNEEWWPYRNQLIITLAAMRLIHMDVGEILLGAVKDDSSHADGRFEFFESMDAVMCQQEGRIRVETPAIRLTSVELVQESGIPHSLCAWAHSCHVANYACGGCRGCKKHRSVMQEAYPSIS